MPVFAAGECGTRRAVLIPVVRKILYYGLIVGASLAGVAIVIDAVIVTDQEQLETFVDDVTGDVRTSRIDHALGWVDLSEESVEVVAGAEPRLYQVGDEADLAEDARSVLAPLEGENATVLQDAIEIDGDSARIALRLSTAEGVCDVHYLMRKRGEAWVMTRVRVL